MKKYAIVLCAALPLLSGCQAETTVNNALATLAGGTNAIAFQAACAIVDVAEGYYANVKSQVTPAQATAEAWAAAFVNAACTSPPTNLTAAFNDLLSAWTVIQAATTVPTAANPNPTVPTLAVTSITPQPTPTPTAN